MMKQIFVFERVTSFAFKMWNLCIWVIPHKLEQLILLEFREAQFFAQLDELEFLHWLAPIAKAIETLLLHWMQVEFLHESV